jgi:hypothetical protein
MLDNRPRARPGHHLPVQPTQFVPPIAVEDRFAFNPAVPRISGIAVSPKHSVSAPSRICRRQMLPGECPGVEYRQCCYCVLSASQRSSDTLGVPSAANAISPDANAITRRCRSITKFHCLAVMCHSIQLWISQVPFAERFAANQNVFSPLPADAGT